MSGSPGSGARDRRGGRDARGGFVLTFVVFMLFSISIAAVTGYIVVESEFELSRYSGQGTEALTVARAGLERFVAEQLGVVDDTVMYALGDGVALVTARRMVAQDSLTELWYIRAEGSVSDVFTPGSPARRVVGGYAIRHRRPLANLAAVAIGANRVDVENGGRASGDDTDPPNACVSPSAASIPGVVAALQVTESAPTAVEGSPQWETWAGGWSDIRAAMGLRWDVLSDPNFPVEFEDVWPNYGSIPADSFPVVRFNGDLGTGAVGRGVLLVDGVLDAYASFEWEGIVIAKHVDDIVEGSIDGMLIAGVEEPNLYATVAVWADVAYSSCSVRAANESLSYLELLPSTIFESH